MPMVKRNSKGDNSESISLKETKTKKGKEEKKLGNLELSEKKPKIDKY